MRQVNGANGKGERRGFLEDITCFGKEDPGGMALEERKKRGRERERETERKLMLEDVMKISGYVMRLPRILLHPRDRPFQEAVRELYDF